MRPGGGWPTLACVGRARDILLLAGSSEARVLAQALVRAGHRVRAVMTEEPREGPPMAVPHELFHPDLDGGLTVGGAEMILDAGHSFDAGLSRAGAELAAREGLPMVSLRRTPWKNPGSADWHEVGQIAEALSLIRPADRVFAATGWDSLHRLMPFRGARLFLRQTSRHGRPAPDAHVTLVFGDPPFRASEEEKLFRQLEIDTLLCRNLGGEASWPKVAAALALEMRIILLSPPPLPNGAEVVRTTSAVLDWVAAQ
ncbi:MAG: precorrin-6A/cobalt-precorrin-6A reductase [Sulfitobacter sp.]|nr:precorrin-6A/cobalt-precorrin-6A reductase [Sulfitobacter sp.]